MACLYRFVKVLVKCFPVRWIDNNQIISHFKKKEVSLRSFQKAVTRIYGGNRHSKLPNPQTHFFFWFFILSEKPEKPHSADNTAHPPLPPLRSLKRRILPFGGTFQTEDTCTFSFCLCGATFAAATQF